MNWTSQIEKSSPAQIRAEASALAISIFGSNSNLVEWVNKFMTINGSGGAAELSGDHAPAARMDSYTCYTPTHTNTLDLDSVKETQTDFLNFTINTE